MDHPPDEQPAVLNYATATAPEPPGWPIGVYLGALVWALITLALFTYRLPKRPWDAWINHLYLCLQLIALSCAAIRLAWAVYRKDKSKGWVLYVVILTLAAPFWRLLERIGYWLGQ
jgi:hypothetical protein